MAASQKKAPGKKPASLSEISDYTPESHPLWEQLFRRLEKLGTSYGFHRIEPVLLEGTGIYQDLDDQSLSEAISFEDRDARMVSLRRQALPGVLRAFSELKPQPAENPQKLWKWMYICQTLRYAAAQKKFASSWEYGFEVLGEYLPVNQVHMLSLLVKFFRDLGLGDIYFEINSTGQISTRASYEDALRIHLQGRKYELCNECAAAIEENPMQVFRCANLECKTVAAEAPQIIDFLGESDRKELMVVLEALDEIGLTYNLNPALVGAVGASGITFTVKHRGESAEYLLGQGSCHDQLMSDITAKPARCFGFSGDFETLESILGKLNIAHLPEARPEVFLVPLGDMAVKKALRLFSELSDEKVSVHDAFGDTGVKNQLKQAENLKATIALIIGQKEAMEEMVILRDIKSGMQELFQYDRVIDEVKKRLGK